MKRIFIILGVVALLIVGGCVVSAFYGSSDTEESASDIVAEDEAPEVVAYQKIDPDEAKRVMDSGDSYILLDVRTLEEFAEEHIAGAILIPSEEIAERAASELPDKDTLIMVYCRSGVRSARVTSELIEMGYTNVYDIGGIIDWPYETIK